jgi:hypothetical protein
VCVLGGFGGGAGIPNKVSKSPHFEEKNSEIARFRREVAKP